MRQTRRKIKPKNDTLMAGVKNTWVNLVKKGKAPLTIMIAPHNEARMFRFRVSVFILWALGLLSLGLVVGVVAFSTGYVSKSSLLGQRDAQNEQLQANAAILEDEINKTIHYGKTWGDAVRSASNVIDTPNNANKGTVTFGGDINIINNNGALSGTAGSNVEKLAQLRAMMEDSIPQLKDISDKMNAQKQLLSEMPTRWPVQANDSRQIGFLSQLFGPSRDPFTGAIQFHTGVDIAFNFGTPVVSAANGTVVKTDYNAGGYGNYVVVRHSYGFSTRYGHLQRYTVVPGQTVVQGQQIGLMGSTGRSTGPHAHFEIMIGTEVIDPMRYLSINNQAYSRYIRDDGTKKN